MSIQLEYGEVSAVDYKTCRIRVRLDDRDGVQSYWLNVPQRHTQATQSRPLMPELGEQVAVLLDADGVGGVYLGGVYSTAEPPPVVDEDTDYVRFSDGTTLTYDRVAHALVTDCVGSVLVKTATTVTVEAGRPVLVVAPSVTLDTPETILTGTLQVAGQVTLASGLQAVGDIQTQGKVLDQGGNSNHHSH
ncbi:phage baseplate assembly protein V [Pseudomonas leptonychotis]|uniref:phage baseplate assembly protein V n=1 Tax=Pseudomonas leptonychotis TaxID=2448482 RepID=UPI003863E88D